MLPLNNQNIKEAKNGSLGFDLTATARISSITPFIYLPTLVYQNIIPILIKDKPTFTVDRFILSSCDTTLYPSIHFRLGEYWFEIKPETYILKESYSSNNATLNATL